MPRFPSRTALICPYIQVRGGGAQAAAELNRVEAEQALETVS
jgi:hypothetical protein